MKWLFFILVLANLGLFLLIYPQQQDMGREYAPADVGDLKLTQEQSQSAATNLADRVESSQKWDMEQDDSDLDQEQRNELQASENSELLTQTKLDSEEDIQPEKQRDEPAGNVELDRFPEQSIRCAILGYVDSRSSAEEISVRLRAEGLKSEMQSETRNEQAGYWVLIPQQSSRRKAVEIAKRLEAAGISDLWRFTSGKLVHAISLGLFRNENRAIERKRKIDEMGFDVVIKPRYREKTDYWLKYEITNDLKIDEKIWLGLVNDFPGLVKKEIDCE